MTSVRISCATSADADRVAGLVADAFTPLAVAAWLVANPVERRAALSGQFRMLVEHAVEHGHVYLAAVGHDLVGTSVWFALDAGELPPPPAYDERLAEICGPHLDRFRLLDAAFEAHHPAEPHHHLAFLAVSPDRQGAGLGSALLRHHHARLDAAGTSGYLEASCPESRDLYLRHGYAAGEPFRLPYDGPPLWPMWRDPVGVSTGRPGTVRDREPGIRR